MPTVVVSGGSGAVGKATISLFRKHENPNVISIGTKINPEANHNILVLADESIESQGEKVIQQAGLLLKEGEKFDAIICVAGGFVGGNAASDGFLASAAFNIKKSLNPALIASHLAAKYLKEGGLLTLTGAANLTSTPGYIGYGVAKAVIHHLVRSLASPGSGLPKDTKVVSLSPAAIDTPANRQFNMPALIPLNAITQRLLDWTTGAIPVPHGKIVEVGVDNNETTWKEL
ncbi:6033_t:CDS:2 [Paraglomus brasilianum]|uniref:Dihydropteridine reductase n=1 Tax=Paraglomus brasilianum TaxID=144538 RepID=A0A9N9BG82_9GLOM|nr:6033_t:CDS:2 [Paraglomus brasilianum]